MASNSQHIKHLLSLYYPSHVAYPAPSNQTPLVTKTISANAKPLLLPYGCCNLLFYEISLALTHYFDVHLEEVVAFCNSDKTQSCLEFKDIGNPSIHIAKRAKFFLSTLTTFPANPDHFRPAPISKLPLQFKNPYSSAMAMSYDYLITLSNNLPEHSMFLFFLKSLTFKEPVAPDQVLYCWFHFRYPELLPHRYSPPKKNPQLSKDSNLQSPSLITCKEKGCTKKYKQQSGLYYHMAHVHTNVINYNVLKCPFSPCTKIYASLTGLRNHLKKLHLQPENFEMDALSPPPSTPSPTCPILPCKLSFVSLVDLRAHMLKTHFWTFYNKSPTNNPSQ
ncbi:hypothetical protein DSO57_1021330 [Entomophthora muscae]|uniref:Uncharacterized protein n=1 Tax=Entomophthora muscae TaxID=34485 RepID=A0ACC2U1C6_9FUNG|nr:hypothetical protein DSO57_1021330 [Entomophthora muscae]